MGGKSVSPAVAIVVVVIVLAVVGFFGYRTLAGPSGGGPISSADQAKARADAQMRSGMAHNMGSGGGMTSGGMASGGFRRGPGSSGAPLTR